MKKRIDRIISIVIAAAIFLGLICFQAWLLEYLQADYTSKLEELLALVAMVGTSAEISLWVERYISMFTSFIGKRIRRLI